jgi:hypothetical protein
LRWVVDEIRYESKYVATAEITGPSDTTEVSGFITHTYYGNPRVQVQSVDIKW